jgi:uncharacterized protein
MNNAAKAYILTSSGIKFNLLETTPDMIKVEDMAHSLANQCRWTGHCRFHYSVAQHGFYCSLLGPEENRFWHLNHDNSEAYIGDMNRPLKHFTNAGDAYRLVEAPLQDLIYQTIGLYGAEPESVKEADEAMLYAEMGQLLPPPMFNVDENNPFGRSKPATIIIEEWTPRKAEQMFLDRFEYLKNKRNKQWEQHKLVSSR